VEATDEPWHGRPASAVMVLPPLAALWFEFEQADRPADPPLS
jgi:1,4-alpha-glucan branching enzyme